MEKTQIILSMAVALWKFIAGASSHKKTDHLPEGCGNSYVRGVVKPYNEELDFQRRTKVKAAHCDIPRFVKFKKKLGSCFHWETIAYALPHIRYDHPELYVALTRFERIKLETGFFLSLFCMFSMVVLLTFMCLFLTGTLALVTYILSFVLGGFGYFIYHLSTPLLFARFIERRLKQIAIL